MPLNSEKPGLSAHPKSSHNSIRTTGDVKGGSRFESQGAREAMAYNKEEGRRQGAQWQKLYSPTAKKARVPTKEIEFLREKERNPDNRKKWDRDTQRRRTTPYQHKKTRTRERQEKKEREQTGGEEYPADSATFQKERHTPNADASLARSAIVRWKPKRNRRRHTR